MRSDFFRPGGVPQRVAIIHNADAAPEREELGEDDAEPPSPRNYVADAEVAEVALHIRAVLAQDGHDVRVLTVVDGLEALRAEFASTRTDVVFNLVECLGGDARREPELPRLLETLRIPYTGNGPGVMRLANAKDMAKRLLQSHGVPVPTGYAVLDAEGLVDPAEMDVRFPVFVKPARTDASIGIDRHSVCWDFAAMKRRVAHLARHMPGPFVIEEYLPGREINVAILPDPYSGAFVPTEIDFTGYPDDIPPIVTYDCKWVPDCPEAIAHSVPAIDRLTTAEYREVCSIARAAFLSLGGSSYGRVDMRFDAHGTPRVIDVNPNNDLHPEAGMTIAAASVGYSYPDLIRTLLAGASLKARHVLAPHSAARPRVIGHVAAAY